MIELYVSAVLSIGCVCLLAVVWPRIAVVVAFALAAFLFFSFQQKTGGPTLANDRLSSEEFRILAISPLQDDHFLLLVQYHNSDIRSYDLHITDEKSKDELLKARGEMRKGKAMKGKARHGRAGEQDDGSMDFGFSEVPESDPKQVAPTPAG